MSMKKSFAFLAGVGTCALAVASCSSEASSPTSDAQSDAGTDPAQSAPGAPASPSAVDPDTALTSKDGQSGPIAQSGSQDADATIVVVVQLQEGADGPQTLASINEAVAAAFPGSSVSVEREYRYAMRGYALRVPAGSIDVIRGVGGVQAVFLDGDNRLH